MGSLTKDPPLFSSWFKVMLRSLARMTLPCKLLLSSRWRFQQTFFSAYELGAYILKIVTRVLDYFCSNAVRIQLELFFISVTSNFYSSQRVPMPPEAPLELIAALPPFFQNFALTSRNASFSILVSWISKMSGWDKDIRFSQLLPWFCYQDPCNSRREPSLFTFGSRGHPSLGCPLLTGVSSIFQ